MSYKLDVSKILSFELEAVVAATENGGIGYKYDLPWRIKGDLPRFKELTENHVVIMGAKTALSMPGGAGLPNRVNIVITRTETNREFSWPADRQVCLVNSPEEALRYAASFIKHQDAMGCEPVRVFLIGGGEIYNILLPFCSKIHWTEVHVENLPGEVNLDTYIDDFESIRWDFYTEAKEDSGYPTHTYHTLKRN